MATIRERYEDAEEALREYRLELNRDGHLFEERAVEFMRWALAQMQGEIDKRS